LDDTIKCLLIADIGVITFIMVLAIMAIGTIITPTTTMFTTVKDTIISMELLPLMPMGIIERGG
jgi:hypothetical protein